MTAINQPEQPLSFNLQLKDVSGTVLCDTSVLLKYDPLKNLPNIVTRRFHPGNATKKNAKIDESVQSQAEVDQSLNKARLLSQELSREHGSDIFQSVAGKDGQILIHRRTGNYTLH